jgi:hypothetical protein
MGNAEHAQHIWMLQAGQQRRLPVHFRVHLHAGQHFDGDFAFRSSANLAVCLLLATATSSCAVCQQKGAVTVAGTFGILRCRSSGYCLTISAPNGNVYFPKSSLNKVKFFEVKKFDLLFLK